MSSTKDLCLTDLEYSEWATRQLLEACARVAPEQLTQVTGTAHRTILHTLRHTFSADSFWVSCLKANAVPPFNVPDPRPPMPEFTLEQLREQWPAVWEAARLWLEPLSAQELDETLLTILPSGDPCPLTRWQIVRHLITHAALHNGQITAMLRILGSQPPNLDFFKFVAMPAKSE